MKNIDKMTIVEEAIYTVSKKEALEILKNKGITESEQMLVKWCRDEVLDAVRITKGPVDQRGILISKRSLDAFVALKSGNQSVEDLLLKIAELEEEVEALKTENKGLKNQNNLLKDKGIKVPKAIKLDEFNLSGDYLEATFKYKRATHKALFSDDGELIELLKRGVGKGEKDVLNETLDEVKIAIEEKRKELLS